ncbi:MAG TPA: ABC transporter ATP-binding protein [bacterium]
MIRIINLIKKFGRYTAVNGLNLEVKKGEVFGLLGPNGAGKTTTFKIIAGLLLPTSGTVLVKEHDILKDPVGAKQLIGFIPDRPYLYEKLTGFEFMQFIGDLRSLKDSKERIDYILDLFELFSWKNELIEGYSHGMKQRLTFAASLLHRPPVLIVDEPVVGLDPKGARLIKGIFQKMREEGRTILMSTHILEIAEELCDRIAIMNEGGLIAIGTLDEIRRIANEERTKLEPLFLKLTGGNSIEDTIRAMRL